ncbi:HDL270Wp [Eremothecium sinecaudum]|uniref:Condensin complex subunit 2 n=1 Tax=Eremothecium sinecaudum TaxID=45286 RepID=A0A0X8HS52_9SACH|nr:HDL270Wp [Eremothecium sinecaudum]AMD20474.1 HDL270Wp [Eremothecium sinecaudum]
MVAHNQYDDDDQGLFTNKSIVMANFEEWIKMATDNKINSRNSWNFALIDYFYDLNVLKDAEDNINFQKASATLDGCVKIYSSRVDSVASETGKLLSGLAERRDKRTEEVQNDHSDEEGEPDDVEIDPATGLPVGRDTEADRKRRTYNRVLETTLVDFDSIKLKELDQELCIDPLFKKALADFDEDGAKSLLINTLNVDDHLRVVFDATTSENDGSRKQIRQNSPEANEGLETIETEAGAGNEDYDMPDAESEIEEDELPTTPSSNISEFNSINTEMVEDEILALGMKYLNFENIKALDICPSMAQLHSAINDFDGAKSIIDNVTNKFDNFLTEQDMQEAIPDISANADMEDFRYELPGQVDDEMFNNDDDGNEPVGNESTPGEIEPGITDKELFAFFDDALKQSWRGRENWKVHNYKHKLSKRTEKHGDESKGMIQPPSSVSAEDKEPKKKAKRDIIDFFDLDDNIEEAIFAIKKSSIDLPQKHREYPHHHLLPNDYKFTADRITKLFIKPEQRMSFFSYRKRGLRNGTSNKDPASKNSDLPKIADENFWANTYKQREDASAQIDSDDGASLIPGTRDSGPGTGIDDDDGGMDFNQAFEDEELGVSDDYEPFDTPTAQNLIKTEDKISYSRTAKKVDVKRLKKNIWRSISRKLEQEISLRRSVTETHDQPTDVNEIQLRFTEIASDIVPMYSERKLKDLSTSFCFICLLHLANEHGFTVANTEHYDDLFIIFNTNSTNSSLSVA